MPDYGDYGGFDPNIPRDWEVWYCEHEGENDGYALLPPGESEAKTISNVSALLATLYALTYDQASEEFHRICEEHNATFGDGPEFTPVDTGYPAWVRCEECDDFVCTRHHGLHAADCECPPIDIWALYDLDPYSTGGQPTQDAE